ncbi:MAG: FKBP-type peptidyl-prolyl cis-trans isomerase [Prevotella sp.]|nr:FKBP-type peptidyl-prolyl cis-trans isomerase [Bacteroidales bacterium]MDY4705956.1 FKBP-type peptidyl-prolyl cis-trans isomerase [Prevotella sp.]
MKDQVAYALGTSIGMQLRQMGAEELDINEFATGVGDALADKTAMEPAEIQAVINEFFNRKTEEQSRKAKSAGEDFLAANAKKEGVVTLPSGLQYQVLREGNGKRPKATDQVRCHYEGTLINGTVFDSSYKRGEPAVFGLNQVIKGWTEGVQLMQEGAKYRFFIPYDLAYGERGAGQQIPPFAALIFDVELIEVIGE